MTVLSVTLTKKNIPPSWHPGMDQSKQGYLQMTTLIHMIVDCLLFYFSPLLRLNKMFRFFGCVLALSRRRKTRPDSH